MNFQSIKFLLLSYVSIGLVSGVLLMLPISTTRDIDFFDAFFTAISALSCTGLIIQDTASSFTHIGHCIILFLIQLGGFGYMSMLGLIYLFLRKSLNNSEKNILKEALNHTNDENIMGFIKKILIYVLVIEFLGGLILSLAFMKFFQPIQGIWYGFFHAISAFNNAGFSVLPNSLIDFKGNIPINLTLSALIFLGGIGYVCLAELHLFSRKVLFSKHKPNKPHKFSLHFKIVMSTSILLFFLAFFIILILEWNNELTFKGFTLQEKLLAAMFTSINYRSAGFSSYDISLLNPSTLFFSITFMAIGAAPGGTTAGIKVTTLAVLFAFYRSIIYNTEPRLFKRSISTQHVQKALIIISLYIFYFLTLSLLLAITESDIDFLKILFELASAFNNVGVSTGDGGILSLCKNFSDIGKILIIASMISGKIGVFIFTFAIFGDTKPSRISYVTEKIIL